MQTSKLNLILARLVFLSTALVCFIGVLLELWYAYHHTSSLPPNAGFTRTFGPGIDGLLNQFSFFTTQSNLILGITTLLLAIDLDRTSSSFHIWRLIGIIDITITGIVFNFVLKTVPKNDIIADTASYLEHDFAPILAVSGWIIFGPAKTVTIPRIFLAGLLPITYAIFTLTRGAIQEWYPYDIMDVPRLGYPGVAINIIGIFVLFLLIAGFLALVDRLLSSKFGRISFPNS
ncbi:MULTISPECIES: Pr6Pr family membrane protein [unclassified Leptospira]|uniref:Pr6Pr family membrane protein n=1 Tax=unclassified Leptospira TaxID=2633828 RepID=UPI0002BF904A|nr:MULTISPECIES: Pr6Pr family membrane protein [unclassified Leptospira]EMJ96998.1 putative membrane protein [Leptospira sp. B5-022]MCR1792538.1 Pr6Pr family membrane protein [Leptospira sp. id769339]